MSRPKNIVCLVIDRLHSGFIGAYGNTWIATPHLDHLAAESFLFDRAVIDSPRLESLYRAYWQGWHALASPTRGYDDRSSELNLLRQLATAGYFTVLMSDDPSIGDLPCGGDFQEQDRLDSSTSDEVAASVDETQLARFFAAAIERLAGMRSPFCLWLHTGSLGRTWDAPLEFREQYADEDDPRPPQTASIPSRLLSRDYDPDELLGIVYSYAGQISLLDLCVGSLVEALAESPFADDTLLVVLSARGISLGEHRRIGPVGDSLYGEVTQIPWFLRFPAGVGQSSRTQALVQPADLCATLAEWCRLPGAERPTFGAGRSLMPLVQGTSETLRDRACAIMLPNERAIATPAWYMRVGVPPLGGALPPKGGTPTDEHPRCELFVKPDDRFEVNEVADRCPDCVAQLQEAFAQFQQSCESPDSLPPSPLPEIIVSGME
jgi:hypothetical protein